MAGEDSGAQAALLAGARLQQSTLPSWFVKKCYDLPALHRVCREYILGSQNIEIRNLADPNDGSEVFFGSGGRAPDTEEREVLEALAQKRQGSAFLLRRLEHCGWNYPADYILKSPQDNLLIYWDLGNPSNEVTDLTDFLATERVEEWPTFVWPYGEYENYRLTVFTPQRNWRLDFELIPSRAGAARPFIRISQANYRKLTEQLESLGQWTTVRGERRLNVNRP